ncbi:hypothetical protein D3C78_820550 [compost metagenome]
MGDGLGDVLAQLPQVLQLLLALAHHAVQHPALLDAVLEGGQGVVGDFFRGGLELQQRIEGALGLERSRHVATAQHLGHGLVGEELEGGEVQLALEGVQHRHDGVEVRRAEDHGGEVLRRTIQAHGGFDHEAQGAFGADEQLAQVVAGGVLDQVLVQLQQVAGAGDHLQAGHPVAGHAVANHLDPAGIGADVAANLAGAGGSEVHRVVQALFLGEVLQLLGDHARLADHGAVELVEAEDLVHVVEGHHHLAIGRHGCGGQAGTAAGGHQRHLVLVGPADDGLHLLDALGEDDGAGRGGEMLGPVLAVGLQGGGVGQYLAGFNQGLQLFDQRSVGHQQNSQIIHGRPENDSGRNRARKKEFMLAYAPRESCSPGDFPGSSPLSPRPASVIFTGIHRYADEQDLSRKEQDQVPSPRRRPPERRGHPEGRRLHQHRVPQGRPLG